MMQVGSISPGIEIWDLDVLDAVEPLATLGGEAPAGTEGTAAGKKKKKTLKVVHSPQGCEKSSRPTWRTPL